MTNDEVRKEMECLNDLLGTMHDLTNKIADREAGRALAGMPTDHDLTKLKDSLVNRSAKVIDRLQDLHDDLVGKN